MNNNETNNETLVEDIDRILHEPARLSILINLYDVDKLDFVYLVQKTGLSKGNLSIHLRKLQQSGYVEIFKNYINRIPRSLVSLTSEGRIALQRYKQIIMQILQPI